MVRMSSIIMPSIVGDRGSHAGCRQKKCDVFCPFVCFLSHFQITKLVITECKRYEAV